ncbi:MAG: TldD/PmbA family protein [Clostridia bacterium]|nr:TldD/PmbA family protein [Clostridia bacterium]
MNQGDFRKIAQSVVEKGQQLGAAMVEAFLLNSKELSIEVAKASVETMKLAEERGLGVRVVVNGQMGFAYSSDLSSQAVEETVRQALANSDKTTRDEHNLLPPKIDQYPQMDIFDPGIRQASVEEKIELAKTIEATARAADPRIKITETSAYTDAEYEVTIANSNGLLSSYQGAYCGAYAFLVAEENGDNQTGFALQYDLKYKNLDPVKIGREAAEKAVRMLGAKGMGTRKAAVVLDPRIATGFLGVMAPALTAEAVQKGRSLFGGKVGQRVAGDKITVIDDGTLAGAVMSAPFDGEGVPTSRTVLIDGGELQGYLYNTYTAAKDGVKSTGNGTRGSFKSTPEIGVTNLYIQPGNLAPDELIKEITDGLYITEVMGMHTANPISGDFSVGAAGILIENGQLTKPVRGIAIAGNILELLSAVDGVGNDLRLMGSKGAPTLRIAQMTISGS